MLKLLFVALGTLASFLLSAQDLHIYYDAFTDSVYYTQNGKPVDRPAVRKGANVVLHVNNYNNYLYNLEIKAQDTNIRIADGSVLDVSSLMNDEGGSTGSPMSLLFGAGSPMGGMPGLAGLSSGSGAVMTKAEQERQQRIAEINTQVSLFNAAYERLGILAEDISTKQEEIQTMLEGQQVQTMVADELERLRFNPQLEPRQIKQLSQEYMERIFGVSDPKQLSLSTVLAKTDVKTEFDKLKTDYSGKVDKYTKDIGVLKATSAVLAGPQYDFPESNLSTFRSQAEKVIRTTEGNLSQYQANLNTITTKAAGISSLDVKKLAELRTTYLVVMDNDFSQTHRQPASSDEMNLNITLRPNIKDSAAVGVSTKALAPIAINVYGGLQINASLGLSFGQFFSRPQSYFVRDSIIRTSDKDAFTPFLTSFVHFYPQSRGSASLGGSFGVGIPLGGSSSLESISFFFGPSLVLGRSQRIVLSGGLMGGKVDQLSDGYAVGERFEVDANLLQTQSVYKLGYFLGISFNLLGK